MSEPARKRTPLFDVLTSHGGKFVPFAGYDMPVQFPMGVKDEHLWTRAHAGLFDVSHMGPCFLELTNGLGGEGAHEAISTIIERHVPSDIANLKPGQARLSVLLNAEGGILDDLIITRPADPAEAGRLYIVVNGAVKAQDFAILNGADDAARLIQADDRALIALQGPEASAALASLVSGVSDLRFMRSARFSWDGAGIIVSRCGYTGEDGFEVLVEADAGVRLVDALLNDERVKPIGLGARDSLRLEAGLCLYGHDIDAETTPVEGDLSWVISKRRRQEGGFPGADKILGQLANGAAKTRVGVQPLGRAPAREGAPIIKDGETIGVITSGGFGPSVNAPIAMGYVPTEYAGQGTEVDLEIRGKTHPARVADLPFITPNYHR